MSIDYTKKYVNTYYYKNGKINKINSTNNPIFGLSVSVYCDDKMVITYYKMQHVYLIYSDILIY